MQSEYEVNKYKGSLRMGEREMKMECEINNEQLSLG